MPFPATVPELNTGLLTFTNVDSNSTTFYGLSVARLKIGRVVQYRFNGKVTVAMPSAWNDFSTTTVDGLKPAFNQVVGFALSTGKTMSANCNTDGTITIKPSAPITVGEYVQGCFEYYCNG